MDLRGLLSNTGFDVSKNLNMYLQLNVVGSNAVLMVDTLGMGNFGNAPDQTNKLYGPQGMSMTLEQLLAQRVILV